MVGPFQNAANIPELRKRLGFTLLMLVIYRLGVFVPTPGIDADKLRRLFEQASSTLFGIVNMFSGGALENFSVLALGITPYISVSIILQLMTTTFKRLEELSKDGQHGRRIITRYTRIGTVVLALLQGMMISLGLEKQGVVALPGWQFRIVTMITLAAGTAFIMWLGEQITERGLGNGISMIIMAGILARMPSTVMQTFGLMSTGEITPFVMMGLLLFGASVIWFIVFFERCQRRVPVQYPRRSVGNRVTQPTMQHLPLKLNNAGVIPPIFASALLVLPATIAQFGNIESLRALIPYLSPPSFVYYSIFTILIVFFCYFYTSISSASDPNQIAEQLKKNGGFIPSVRPGRDTANYLNNVISRLTLWGAIYIASVCIIPTLFYLRMGAASFTHFFGGTAILIVVGVLLDTIGQIQSHLLSRNYEDFVNRSSAKSKGAARAMHFGGRLIQR